MIPFSFSLRNDRTFPSPLRISDRRTSLRFGPCSIQAQQVKSGEYQISDAATDIESVNSSLT